LPEVSLVAILDADKEAIFGPRRACIQTAGRAARHLNGEVILYADVRTQSIQKFLGGLGLPPDEATRLQLPAQHHPRSVRRAVEEAYRTPSGRQPGSGGDQRCGGDFDLTETLRELEEEMLRSREQFGV